MAPTLTEANLKGDGLLEARGLMQEQLDVAEGDDRTRLRNIFTRPAHWSKAERPENRPAAQPDDGGQAPATVGVPGPGK